MKWVFFIMALFAVSGIKAQSDNNIVSPGDFSFNTVQGTVRSLRNGSPIPGWPVMRNNQLITHLAADGTFSISASYRDVIDIGNGYFHISIPLNNKPGHLTGPEFDVFLVYKKISRVVLVHPDVISRDTAHNVIIRPMPRPNPDLDKADDANIPQYDKKKLKNIFPFPPPRGYTNDILNKSLFARCTTLSDVSSVILNALRHCQYDDKSYYPIPNGFALVTKVEEMNSDGTSVMDDDRFSLNKNVNMRFWDWFSPRRGYFRVFAFLVTDQTFQPTDDTIDQETAEGWVDQGMNDLPDSIGNKPYNSSYDCTVIVYEFRAPDVNQKLQPVIPARLSAVTHLDKSTIAAYLNPEK